MGFTLGILAHDSTYLSDAMDYTSEYDTDVDQMHPDVDSSIFVDALLVLDYFDDKDSSKNVCVVPSHGYGDYTCEEKKGDKDLTSIHNSETSCVDVLGT